MKKNIVIIGGGISGLATAFYIKQKLNAKEHSYSITLLEQEPQVGGNIKSVKDQGFIFDGGPRGFLAGGRQTLQMAKDLGIWDQVQVSSDDSRIRYVWRNGKLNALPKSPLEIFSSELVGWKEIKTALSEYSKRNNPSIEDESVAEFFIRRFSEDILDYFVELLVTGIYAGNPKRLSAKSIFPRLKELEAEYGSVLKGLWKSKKKKPEENFDPEVLSISKRKLVSFNDGMEVLVKALHEYLNESIKTNCKIQEINYQSDNTATIEYLDQSTPSKIEADLLVFATPSFVTADLIKPYSSDLYELLNSIEYSHIHVVCPGYKKKVHDYHGFGFLSPRKERLKMLGCIWNEMVFPTLAPKDCVNLTAMFGGACHPEMRNWSKDQLLSVTQNELKLTMDIDEEPDMVHIFQYDRGIPQYNIGHDRKIQNILEILEKNRGIFVVGSYINGVGVNDCIRNAYDLVENLNLEFESI